MGATSISTDAAGAIKRMLAETGRVSEPILAAGQLRQGKAPSMVQMVTGVALIEIWRPRRSKLLPRHFILAVTADEVIAFKCSGGSGDDASSDYKVRVSDEVENRYPRGSVSLGDLEEGEKSKGGTLTISGESFPVCRPNLTGEPNTDELIAVLAGLNAANV